MDEILKKFQGAPLGYWHDVGHAHHLDIIGVFPQENWLEKFKDFLLGVHLHDAKGREDHLAPGTGEINFNSLIKQLEENSIKVIEVHSKVEEKDLKESLKFLNKNFQN
jgi:sugar phosphate isomerase/epimerase